MARVQRFTRLDGEPLYVCPDQITWASTAVGDPNTAEFGTSDGKTFNVKDPLEQVVAAWKD